MITQLDWMIRNIDRLVEAIRLDGRMGGPRSEPILLECAQYSGQLNAAKYVLKKRLDAVGLGHLLTALSDEEVETYRDNLIS